MSLTPDEIKARFPHASESMIQANAKPQKPKPAPKESETELQRHAENWLRQRGYMRLTADLAESEFVAPMRRGWFGHIVEAERNPLLPDLMIWDGYMHCFLGIELKTRNRYQRGQREMIDMLCWIECRTLDELKEKVSAWERRNGIS